MITKPLTTFYVLFYLGVVTPAEVGNFLFATTSVMNLANLDRRRLLIFIQNEIIILLTKYSKN